MRIGAIFCTYSRGRHVPNSTNNLDALDVSEDFDCHPPRYVSVDNIGRMS